MAGSLIDLSGANDGGAITDAGAGAIPDGGENTALAAPPHADAVNAALNTVRSALDYGRQKYGLTQGKGQDEEPAKFTPYEGMRQSDNIEDRRGDTGAPTTGDTSRTKFDDVVDRGREFVNGYNPMSQSLGIGDVATKGAIPDEQEEAP